MWKYKRYTEVFDDVPTVKHEVNGSLSNEAKERARERGDVTTLSLLPPPQNVSILFKADLDFKKHVQQDDRPRTKHHDLPVSYDQRVLHPLTSRVYDQGNCGSCWSIAVLSAIEDKCIKRETPITLNKDVARRFSHDLCEGGNAGAFLDWLTRHDAVEALCLLNRFGWCNNLRKLQYVRVIPSSVRLATHINNIKRDILKHGSVVAGLLVYDNFKHGQFGPHEIYLDSVEKYTIQGRPVFAPLHTLMGGHSVVIIGWGSQEHVEVAPGVFETVEYWLCRNSWGSHWGQQGHFKIATGHHNKTVRLEHFYHHKGGRWGGVLTFDIEPVVSRYAPVYVYLAVAFMVVVFIILVKLKFKTFKRKY